MSSLTVLSYFSTRQRVRLFLRVVRMVCLQLQHFDVKPLDRKEGVALSLCFNTLVYTACESLRLLDEADVDRLLQSFHVHAHELPDIDNSHDLLDRMYHRRESITPYLDIIETMEEYLVTDLLEK